MNVSITGKWIGEYVYGAGYEPELIGKRVAFEMDLSADEDLITGFCIDEETKHLFEKGSSIEGSYNGGAFVFYKTYPYGYDFYQNGEAYISNKSRPASIQYTGLKRKKLFSRQFYFKGFWEIDGSYLDENGSAVHYRLEGTWKMKRK